jgi:hypothetical protein
VPYYSNFWSKLNITLPAQLPSPRTDAKLVVKLLSDGITVGTNEYDITLADKSWVAGSPADLSHALLVDPKGTLPAVALPSGLNKAATVTEALAAKPSLLVVADASSATKAEISALTEYARAGGKLLLLHPGASLRDYLPEAVMAYRPVKGEIVTMHVPESPVFEGIEPLDLSWFEVKPGQFPYACGGVYRLDRTKPEVTVLADYCDFHGYLEKHEQIYKSIGVPILQAKLGQGELIASEMMVESAANDPIAARLLNNLISALGKR